MGTSLLSSHAPGILTQRQEAKLSTGNGMTPFEMLHEESPSNGNSHGNP